MNRLGIQRQRLSPERCTVWYDKDSSRIRFELDGLQPVIENRSFLNACCLSYDTNPVHTEYSRDPFVIPCWELRVERTGLGMKPQTACCALSNKDFVSDPEVACFL